MVWFGRNQLDPLMDGVGMTNIDNQKVCLVESEDTLWELHSIPKTWWSLTAVIDIPETLYEHPTSGKKTDINMC